MQISAWHKSQGDQVGFEVQDPDRVYISCIFKKNAPQARGIQKLFSHTIREVYLGGSAISFDWLPEKMQKIKPDYDLYPSTYSLGFTTRGCIRHCQFCIVPDKEGRIRPWMKIQNFIDDRFRTVVLLDNNALAMPKIFFETTDFILDNNLKVDYNQGLDIRLLNEKIASRLAGLNWAATLKFAWDNLEDESKIIKGIDLLKEAGLNLRHKVQFYILVGFNTTIEEDIYRCQKLKELGTNAFVMKFKSDPKLNALARWANRKWLYWSIDFKEYKR